MMIDGNNWMCLLIMISLITTSCHAQDRTNEAIKTINDLNNTSVEEAKISTLSDTISTDAPYTITRNITQDRTGNIWFATFGGAIKYDGNSFNNLTKDQPIRFFAVHEDRQGMIWFGSIGHGVYRYDGNAFQTYRTSDGLVNDRVSNIYEDNDGKIWFGTEGGISIYSENSFTNLTTEQGLLDDDINSIIQDETGIYWIGTRGKAFTYDGRNFSEIVNNAGDSFYNVRHILIDSRGYIWMGGNDGLWRYDGESYMRVSRDFTGYIYEDRVGNILTSSVGSNLSGWTLSQYDRVSINNNRPEATVLKTGEDMFFGIYQDRSSNIWVGKLDGVYHIDTLGAKDFKE
jgi:ligand-binding sensor domain-containing protein